MPDRPSVLLVLPQLPHDPASGAARSMRSISAMLAAGGFAVRALAVTATERAQKEDTAAYLASLGIEPEVGRRDKGNRPELSFFHRGISYRLLDTAGTTFTGWQELYNRQFDRMFDEELEQFDPDVMFTFGGTPADVRRRRRARRRGVKVVFGLRNMGYLAPGALDETDAILAASRFLADRYRDATGVVSTPLPSPIEMEDVAAPERQPIFVTMINPTVDKGLMVFARIAEEVSVRRPTVAFLVIEARGTGGQLGGSALAGGFDLRRHENILVSPPTPRPADIYAGTRLLLAPSVAEDAAPRVIAEALVNGIPPIVSDRGGLSEAANGGGFIVPLPAQVTTATLLPVSAEIAAPWVDLILRLTEDEGAYAAASRRALEAGRVYRADALTARYLAFFMKVLEL
jgi:hypothetical protein